MEYLHLNTVKNIKQNLTYQLLVFVADIQDKLTVFQSADEMAEISYPSKMKMIFKNVQCQLVLINGIKVHSGVIKISNQCSMVRVIQRDILDLDFMDKNRGLSICPKLSHPKGQYLNWPLKQDQEGMAMLRKVYPVANLFFERCSLIHLLPVSKFQINSKLDSFLRMKSIFNEWALLDRKVSNTKHLAKKPENEKSTADKSGETSSSSSEVTPAKGTRPSANKRPRKPKTKQRYNSGTSKKVRRSLFGCGRTINETSTEGSTDEKTQDLNSSGEDKSGKTINLLTTSGESETESEPTDLDKAFIDDRPLCQVSVRPIVEFSPDQQKEFLMCLTHYQLFFSGGEWFPFDFKYLRTRDFCQIVCQTLTDLDQNQIKSLEEFIVGKKSKKEDMEAIFGRMNNTPPNFAFEF